MPLNFNNAGKITSKILFIIYLVYLLYLVFFSQYYGRGYYHHSYNVVPFKTVSDYLLAGTSSRLVLINIAGNILAFVPMGFLLPVISERIGKLLKVFMIVLAVTCFIEVLQYIMGVGVGDIDDVILNVIGGLSGYTLFVLLSRLFVNRSKPKNEYKAS